jgi:Membrane-bound toxin component of toxin-antitoxin system
VKSTPVLRATLQPSRIAAALLASATIATAAMLALLPEEHWLRAAAVLITAACGIRALRRTTAIGISGSTAAIELAGDGRAMITDQAGRRIDGIIQPQSYVGARLTTLVIRPDGALRSRALAVWPDTMSADEFRHLRVLLRHGDSRRDPV